MNDVDDFLASIQAACLAPPEWPLQVDGQIHRYSTNGRHRDDAGWYVLHLVYTGRGTRMYGAAGDWRSGNVLFWHSGADAQSPAEAAHLREAIREQQAQLKADKLIRHRAGRDRAQAEWARAIPCDLVHPYLQTKGLPADPALRVAGTELLVPMRDWNGELWNLQHISPNGTKVYGRGRASGLVLVMGNTDGGTVLVCEGYATGRSALLAGLADAVVVAFSSGQLRNAALEVRTRWPRALRWVLADNDKATPGNPGLTAAAEAAEAAHCGVLVPSDGTEDSHDFNDLWVAYGRGAHSYLTEVTK
jgi:putative DNA primase/helicase